MLAVGDRRRPHVGIALFFALWYLLNDLSVPENLSSLSLQAEHAAGNARVDRRRDKYPITINDGRRPALAWNLCLPGNVHCAAPFRRKSFLAGHALSGRATESRPVLRTGRGW